MDRELPSLNSGEPLPEKKQLKAPILPANHHFLEVEPRGFEPLASAVQMRPEESANVRPLS
jgi:hypothetical protein